MARRSTWDQHAAFFFELAKTLMGEWGLREPSCETLPSHELELAVDCWCAIQAQNLGTRLKVPPEVRPWMLARITMAAGSALELSVLNLKPAPPLDPATITGWLCGEWHGALRERWEATGKLQRKKRRQRRVRVGILIAFALILLGGIAVKVLR